MEINLREGLTAEVTEAVTNENTAKKYGSGSIDVYATPAMIGLMEKASLSAVDPLLPEGFSTVGIKLDVKHMAATPVGMNVTAKAELLKIEGKKLTFKVEAFDAKDKVGEGEHERFIVELSKFMARVDSKKA
jgi:predicted thioesterase